MRVKNGEGPLTWALCGLSLALVASYLLPPLLQGEALSDTYYWSTWLRFPEYSRDAADSWRPMILAFDHLRSGDPTPVYDKLLLGEIAKFQYPPSSLFPLSALQALGVPRRDWLPVLNQLLLVPLAGVVFLTCRIWQTALAREARGGAPPRSRLHAILMGAAVVALTVVFQPLVHALRLGQAQLWIDLLAAAMVWCWMDGGRDRGAGFCAGVACLIKPMFGLLLVWALVRGRLRFAATALVVLLAGTTVSIALYGVRQQVDYLHALSYLSARGEAVAANQSVNGCLHLLFGVEDTNRFLPPYDPIIHMVTAASSAALVGLLLLSRPAVASAQRDFDAAAALVTAVIAAPIAWGHHYAVILPLYAWVTPRLLRLAPFGRWTAPYLAATFLLMCRDYHGPAALLHGPWALLRFHRLLAGLLLLHVFYRAEPRSWWLHVRRSKLPVAAE